jgi:hypothetical protein
MNIDKQELEKSLLVVYQKNLNFLKENFSDIFLEVEQLSQDIQSEKYKEKYSLELRNGYLDILNLDNKGYYYAKNSYVDAEHRANNVDTTNNSSFDLLRKQGSTQYLAYPSGLKNILPVVDFVNKKIDLKNVEFQKIMKFMYIGVGLGYHIQEIDKKIRSYTTLIIEPELEIFRLSLFATDFEVFHEGNRTLFLNIGDDKKKRDNSMSDFYNCHEYMNYNIKHYMLLQNLDYIKEEAVEFFRTNFSFSFPYTLVIQNVRRTVGFIRHKDNFLVVNDIKKQDVFKDKEVLLISAGPSLDNYIELIKKYQDSFIIVSVDVILRKLEKHNIVPDIVFSIDPSALCAGYLKTEDPEYLKHSAIILLSQQHPEVMQLLRERKLNYYFSQFTQIIDEIGYLGSVPNVGTFTFQTMVHLGAKELYLIGTDAAFNQETGSRYSSDSSYSKIEDLNFKQNDSNMVSNEDIVEVKGNLRDVVKTNLSLLDFKYHFDTSITHLGKSYEYKASNLSDGVFIDGLHPMEQEEFIKIAVSSENSKFDAVEKFNSISKVIDADCYEDDIKIINGIIQRAKKFQKLKISSRDEFLTKKLDLMIWILERSKKLSIDLYGRIFLQYTSIVDAYINFAINLKQKDLYTKENLEQLSNYWAQGVVAVFKDMKDSVGK